MIKNVGKFDLYLGPMFSGKSSKCIHLASRYKSKHKQILMIKPAVDTRFSETQIVTHNNVKIDCVNYALNLNVKHYDIIIVDEIQFLRKSIVKDILQWVKFGIIVIGSGLSGNFKQAPMGQIPELLSIADTFIQLKALCHLCDNDAPFTYMVNNLEHIGNSLNNEKKFIPVDKNKVILGGKDKFIPLCRSCAINKI